MLTNEKDFTVWSIAINEIWNFGALIEFEPYYGTYKEFIASLTVTIANELGWNALENDPHPTKLLRGRIQKLSGLYGNHQTISDAMSLFSLFQGNSDIFLSL